MPWDTHAFSLPLRLLTGLPFTSRLHRDEESLQQGTDLSTVASLPGLSLVLGTAACSRVTCGDHANTQLLVQEQEGAEPSLPQFLLECSARGAQGLADGGHTGLSAQLRFSTC